MSIFQAENLTSDAESVAEAKSRLRAKTMSHCQTLHLKRGALHCLEECFQYLTWVFVVVVCLFVFHRAKLNKSLSVALRE